MCQSWLPDVASGPLERAVLWLTTGLAVVSLLSWLSTLAGLSFDTYVIAVQWLLAVVFAAALAGRARPAATGIPPVEPVLDDGAQRTFIIVALVLATFSAVYPARIEFHGDALDHIGYVRCIQSENSLDPGGVLAQTGDSVTKSDPRKGTIHDMAALVSRIADVDPAGVWSVLPVVLLPLAFLSFVWFCSVFVPRGFLVFFCAALFLLFQGGMGFLYGGEITNGQNVALLFYWTLVPLCFRFAATGARRVLVALVVVCAGGALIHIGLVAHFVILLATLLAFHRWCGLTARNVLRLCAWGGAAIAVVSLWKWVHSVSPGNWIHVHPQGLLYVTGRFFVASPFEILRQYGLVFLGGLVFVPLLLFGVRNSRHARLNIAFSAIPYAICFCPLLAPFFYDHAAYMAFRSILNVPLYAAVVTGVYLIAAWARRRWWPAKLLVALGLLVWSHLFLAPSLDAFTRAASQWRTELDRPSLFERYDDLIRFLETRPRGSVVLSDPKTSYLVSATTGQRVVAVPGQHGNPNDFHAFERLSDVRDVLSPYMPLPQATAICDRYGVDYVVVNGRQDPGEWEYLSDWTADSFGPTLLKLTALDTHFRPVFERDDIVVLHYYPGEVPRVRWVPFRSPVEFGFEGMTPCRVGAPDNEFRIVSVDVSPRDVLPGETVTVRIGYDMQDLVSYGLPPVVFIRFDHQSIASSEKSYPGEKQVRRARERGGGYLLRYRVDHRPFGGRVAPDRWPVGVTFYEAFPVRLPSALEPGTYTVQFRVARETVLPNYTVRDLFYNRDHYSGRSCLTLSVSSQVVR